MTPFYIENVGDEDAKFIINGHYYRSSSYIFGGVNFSVDDNSYELMHWHLHTDEPIIFDDEQLMMSVGSTIVIQPRQRTYLKLINTKPWSNVWYRSTIARCSFIMSGKIALGGNIMSLANSEYLTDDESPNYCLKRIFNSRKMTDESGKFVGDGYSDIPCTSIVRAPEFPKIKLSTGCYQEMFYDCANLEGSISLNATELAADCYTDMFHGCEKVSELHFPKSFADDGNEIFKSMPGSPNFGAVNAKVIFDL